MAAFRASRFVWLAISEITWMISLICCELVRICSIDSTDFCTALPPSSASWLASLATLLASVAFSLTASTERASSSIEAVISSTLALCVCAPGASVCELSAITREPSANWLALSLICSIAAADVGDHQVHIVAQLAVGAGILRLDGLREILVRHPLAASRRCRCIGVTKPSSVSFMPRMISRYSPWNLRVVGAGVQLALGGGLGQRRGFGDQAVDRVDALVEVVLDLVEVAVVVVGDLRRDVALGDPVDVLGRHVQRADRPRRACR